MIQATAKVSLALALCLPTMLCADDGPKTQDKDLDGKWESTSVVTDGERERETYLTIVIDNNKVVFTVGTRIMIAVDREEPRLVEDASTFSGTISVNASAKTMDFLLKKDDATDKILGIYNVRKDALLLCLPNKGNDRPTEFTSKKGDGWMLVRLKRIQKKTGDS